MNLNMFPEQYKKLSLEHMEQQKRMEELKAQNRIHSLDQQIKEASDATNSKINKFGLVGAVVGFFACCGCAGGITGGENIFGILILSLLVWGGCWFLGDQLGRTMGMNAENQIRQDCNALIAQENADLENKKKQIEQTGMQQINQYKKEFDEQAKKLSVSYANSKLAQDVISWMTEGYSKRIAVEDRRPHIKTVEVPYGIKVYTNKITCNQGEYDFNIHRCKNLETPLDQTALARAISNAIRLNIMMKFPKDPSGTKPEVKIKVKYTEQYPEVNLIYIAPNGKYVDVTSWTK
ncbi:MAG: hypothetical protein ACI4F9_04070 [Lachnospiraceae bacterium]